jgi:hypothetical protein
MYDDQELLSHTLDTNSQIDFDSVDVLTRANAIARSRRRQRWVVQVTGVSLVTAGLVAGGLGLPRLLSGSAGHGHAATIRPADGGSGSTYTTDQEDQAFFDAGYQYQDAQQLATLWNASNLDQVKAQAGEMLLDGESLPIPPSGQPVAPEDQAVQAFFAAGYSYNDAVTLAGVWKVSTYQAKIQGGTDIENGEGLPIPPSGNASNSGSSASTWSNRTASARAKHLVIAKVRAAHKNGVTLLGTSGASDSGSTRAIDAFMNAGYEYSEAQRLASLWHKTNVMQVKAEAGKKLLADKKLPIPPSGQPATSDNSAVETFFSDGYTTTDAIRLAKMWKVSTHHAKVEGGAKLQSGETLPIHP